MFGADLADQYKSVADRLIDAALADNDGYQKLAYLCDRIGARLSGMPSLDRAIEWSEATMKRDGLSNVRVIPVKVPKWVRGAESAQMLAPEMKPLHMLGLGMSVGTPRGGITADAVVVDDFDQLNKLGADGVRGKIVVYNETWVNYGTVSQSRALDCGIARRGGCAGAFDHAAGDADPAYRYARLR
jgi:hypothetical protein